MAELVTILAAYTSVVLTIILAVLGFMLYHFVPVKVKVGTMWHDLYNGAGSGHIKESDDERDSIMDMLETAEEQREEMSRRNLEVVVYLNDLSEYLKEPDGSEAPHLIEDNYVEDREN